MISEFIESWSLFGQSYLAGWSIALVLSLAGVVVVARNQIFIGVAVSEASALGVALVLWLGGVLGSSFHFEAVLQPVAVLFAIAAMLLTSGRPGEYDKETYEALTGWVFLLSASFTVLLLAHSPHGQAESQHVLSSTILGATMQEVAVFCALFVALAVFIYLFHRELLLFSLDPMAAAASGLNLRRWSCFISLALGLVIGLSIPSSGMLYTFGCLVLPPLIAKSLCSEVRLMFIASPLLALTLSGTAFVLANHFDYPPAQLAVATLSTVLGCVWLLTCFIRRS